MGMNDVSQRVGGAAPEAGGARQEQGVSPIWEGIKQRIECPLCRYELRGLSEPRCPECGYSFEWQEGLDPRRRKHRYLFEHHPERNFWSLGMTLLGGFWPWNFWKTLHPAQAGDRRRLTIYRWVCMGIAMVPLVVMGVWKLMLELHWKVNEWPRWPLGQLIDVFGRKATTLSVLVQPLLRTRLYIFVIILTIVLLALPELSGLALSIYRASMRKAKIDRLHVARCVTYSYDFVVWPVMAMLLLGLMVIIWSPPRSSWQIKLLCWMLLLLAPAVWMVMSIRLACAYRYYLRMRHAVAAVLAGQVIVILVVGIALEFLGSG